MRRKGRKRTSMSRKFNSVRFGQKISLLWPQTAFQAKCTEKAQKHQISQENSTVSVLDEKHHFFGVGTSIRAKRPKMVQKDQVLPEN